MSFDFDTLYHEYVNDPWTQRLGYTSVRSFYNHNSAHLNQCLDDGLDIDPEVIFIEQYVSRMLEQDPDWFNHYEPGS